MLRRTFAAALAAALFALSLTASASPSTPARPAARTSPAWVRDGVVYEIFPRAFSEKGDLAGVTARLDDLQRLGVTVLWLMPINPVGKVKSKGTLGSPYAVRDFHALAPELGTPADLKRLVAEAHKRGMKVITDQVLNHTSWDNVLLESHPDFYTRDAAGKVIPPNPDWSDVADLNYDNPKLHAWMIEMLQSWVREYDLDGFRFDVAWGVPRPFWEATRVALEKQKPGILMLAESELPELLEKACDVDYAWAFHATLTRVLQGEAPASRLREVWEEDARRYPRGALRLRFSDNHDERRAIVRFGERGALAGSAVVFGLDGVPLLYNGQEIGDTTESGAPALFERRPIFWPFAERRPEFPRFYAQMTALRRAHPALRQGETAWVRNSDEARVLTWLRRDGKEEFLIAVNLSSQPWNGTVEVASGGPFADVALDDPRPLAPGHSKAAAATRGPVSLPALFLDGWEFRIFRRQLAPRR